MIINLCTHKGSRSADACWSFDSRLKCYRIVSMQNDNLKLSCLTLHLGNTIALECIEYQKNKQEVKLFRIPLCSKLFLSVCKPFCLLSIKLKYLGFFYHFSICFVSFYIFKSWILSYEFMLSKGKNMEEMCVYNHAIYTYHYLFHFTFLPLHTNPLYPADFTPWRQKCCL